MAKFKVGDKVRILDAHKIKFAVEKGFNTDGIYEVVDIEFGRFPVITNEKGILDFTSDELPYIEKVNKPTNNQRITALEKEVAELKLIVHELRKPSAVVEDKQEIKGATIRHKTPNELRAEIIEKAKQFIEKHSEGFLFDSDKNSICAAKLEKFQDSLGYGACIGYSRCHRDDVFNAHIGKAIALGRALGLDVSEFEQAVKPTEKVVGMKVLYVDEEDFVVELKPSSFASLYSYKLGTAGIGSYVSEHSIIIDDTNAIYGGDE